MLPVTYDPERYGVDYDDLIDTMEFDEILAQESDDNYQGDTYMLVYKLGQYGHLTFGWGSCLGCDAAQAVSSQKEAEELRDSIYYGIHWFETWAEALDWVCNGDHELQYYGHESAFSTYREKAQEVLLARKPPSAAELAKAEESIRTVIENG